MNVGLVLSRKISEQIVIGDELVVITVVGIIGKKVRIGILADNDLPIHRREIFEAKKLGLFEQNERKT